MPQTLGYARISTPDQDISGQLMRLADAGAARSYQDVVSGRVTERPGLTALLDYARAGDTLMVVRLDRLGRSLRELLTTVDDLKGRGVTLVSLEERIDTSSAAGELVFHVFGARVPRCPRRTTSTVTPWSGPVATHRAPAPEGRAAWVEPPRNGPPRCSLARAHTRRRTPCARATTPPPTWRCGATRRGAPRSTR